MSRGEGCGSATGASARGARELFCVQGLSGLSKVPGSEGSASFGSSRDHPRGSESGGKEMLV